MLKQIASGSLRYDPGHPKLVLGDNLKGWGGDRGGRAMNTGWMGQIYVYGRFTLMYAKAIRIL